MAEDDSPEDAPSSTPSQTGFTPGDDNVTRWRNWFALLTRQMTHEGKQQYVADTYRRHAERDRKLCEEHRDWVLQYSAQYPIRSPFLPPAPLSPLHGAQASDLESRS